MKFRCDASGRVVPSPYTVTYPALVGAVTVTFNTTADTPEAGTPPRPATCNATVLPATTGAFGAPTPARVSNNRDGDNDVNPPGMLTAADALTGARLANTPTTTHDDNNDTTARNRPLIAKTPFPAYRDSPQPAPIGTRPASTHQHDRAALRTEAPSTYPSLRGQDRQP